MCSYNRINGVYASQDPWLLTDLLRHEWGFDGLVVSDWGAVDDPVAAVAAGLDLEMPSSKGASAAADRGRRCDTGELDEAVLDTAIGAWWAARAGVVRAGHQRVGRR
jgi:beta-glucosidase